MSIFKRNKNTQPVEEQRQTPQQPQQPKQEPVYYSPWSEALLFGAFNTRSALFQSAVYSALSLISESIASLDINIKQDVDGKRTVIPKHRISRLFYTANIDKFTLIHNLVWDFLLWGNSYAFIKRDESGQPIKLIYLERNDVTINYIKQTDTLTYQVTNHNNIPNTVRREDMLHFVNTSADGVQGRGFLWFARNAIKLTDNAEQSAEDFFGSGCALSGALKFDGRLTDAQKQQIRTSWQQIHSGPNASGLVILEGSADYQPISSNAADSQLIETRSFQILEIARFFKISPVLLGDLSHSGYSSIEDSSIEFCNHTLAPIISNFQEQIDRKLLNDSTTLYSDIDETKLMRGNRTSTASYITTLVNNGIITINEGREMIDMNRVEEEDADKLHIPFTDISQNEIGENTNTNENENNEQQ